MFELVVIEDEDDFVLNEAKCSLMLDRLLIDERLGSIGAGVVSVNDCWRSTGWLCCCVAADTKVDDPDDEFADTTDEAETDEDEDLVADEFKEAFDWFILLVLLEAVLAELLLLLVILL